MKEKTTVLFYDSSLDDIKAQKFYQIDFDIIKKNGYNLILTDKKSELLKWWKYDILFVYFYTWGAFSALIARLLLKKVFFTGGIDSLDRLTASKTSFIIQKFFFLICYFLSTKCIIVSDNDWENVKKEYGGKLHKKLVKSYHVIDVDKFWCINEQRQKAFMTVCWQGTVENIIRKGVDQSIKVFKFLKSKPEFCEYTYNIIGKKGAGTAYLKEIIEDSGMSDSVNILGEVDEENKIRMMKESNYYFQLSKYEGFGLAAMEALAAGNIVIHTNAGGLKYVVGENGIIYNEQMPQDCFEVLYQELITFDYPRIKPGQERIRKEFSYSKRLKDFESIFQS